MLSPAGILIIAGLGFGLYLGVGKPVAHGVKKAGQAIGHTVGRVVHPKPKK